MREVDSSAPPPPLSAMFQKLATAVKTKTFELFTEDEDDNLRWTRFDWLMEKAGWGLDLAEVDYAEKGHNRYALLSYVCLGMFRGFDDDEESYSLRELMQHVSSDPMELLERDKDCAFSRKEDKRLTVNLTRGKVVGFTVVPGFKVGCTVIQSQVYLTSLKCK
ncbi:hypothetical protein IGI04_014187 [Brassica rapa subsp. trilocularis]|uniref:GIL1/IRKI C-terminal domain-containing protein n=1 Tax=Brassica rapa subsp. trilocularis TaxID=1813537 RepID=A0ABQ7MNZ1_BRACM|nr:hypothetical protein IGI04_014187 [Brassica rapa subsp. trilocularis]